MSSNVEKAESCWSYNEQIIELGKCIESVMWELHRKCDDSFKSKENQLDTLKAEGHLRDAVASMREAGYGVQRARDVLRHLEEENE